MMGRIRWTSGTIGYLSKRHWRYLQTITRYSSRILNIQPRRIGSYWWAFLLPCGCLWFVTVTGVAKRSYESFRHAKQPSSNGPTTPRGGKNEKRVRFFKGYEEPLCEVFQKTGNDSFGWGHHQIFQENGRWVGDALSNYYQPLSPRLCCDSTAFIFKLETRCIKFGLPQKDQMNKTKQKMLEKKGWKVSTVEEFLGLSPEESRCIESKLSSSKTGSGHTLGTDDWDLRVITKTDFCLKYVFLSKVQ